MKSKKIIKSLLSVALLTLSFATITDEKEVNADTVSYEYVKVTTNPTDWSGEYLIVYEGEEDTVGSVAFDGSLDKLDDANNNVNVTITDGTIAYSEDLDSKDFTIAKIDASTYSILSASGKYIGNSSNSNSLTSSDSKLTNTISLNGSNIDIKSSGGAYLRYNNASNQNRFRYFKSASYTNQKAIQLYKKTEVNSSGGEDTPVTQWTVSFNTNGGTSIEDLTVNNGSTIDESSLTTTKTDWTLEGWYKEESLTNKWNFTTDTITSNITLYAKWLNTACLNGVENAKAYANLAYKYTYGDKEVTGAYKAITSVDEVQDGSKVIIVSVYNNDRYALTSTTETANKSLKAAYVTAENNYLSSYDKATIWTVNGNNTDGFTLSDGSNYLSATSSNANLKMDSSGATYTLICDEKGSYFGIKKDTSCRSAVYNNISSFKNYAISNVNTAGYATSLEIYVETDEKVTVKAYSDVDFRLQLGVNKTEMEQLVSNLPENATYGIEISTTDRTEKVSQEKLTTKLDDNYYYVIVSLGDIINNIERATTKFTVKVYVEYEDDLYYSNTTREFTVTSMVETYYADEATKDKVAHLYNFFNESGFFNQEV